MSNINLKKIIKQLLSDSFVFGIGRIISKGIGLLLLPIYTRIFSTSDYGTIELLNLFVTFVSLFIMLRVDSAQSFFFFKFKNDKHTQSEILGSSYLWCVLWGGLVSVILLLNYEALKSYKIFENISTDLFFLVLIYILITSLINLNTEIFRYIHKPWKYLGIKLGNSLVSIGIGFIFIFYYKFGVKGIYVGSCIGGVIFSIISFINVRKYYRFDKNALRYWRKLLRFSIPLVPDSLATFVINALDRWFVMLFIGKAALGIYAVGSRFAMMLLLVVESFRIALWPILIENMHKDDGKIVFKAIARMYVGFGISAVIVLTFVAKYLVMFFASKNFYGAYTVVGILAWTAILQGFLMISSASFWKKEKTSLISVFTIGAALLNFILNSHLIPVLGAEGAAIATAITYLVWNVLMLVVSEKIWTVGYEFKIMFFMLIFGVFTHIVIVISQNNEKLLFASCMTCFSVITLLILSFNKSLFMELFYKNKFFLRN